MAAMKLKALQLANTIRVGNPHMAEKHFKSDKFDMTLYPSGHIRIHDIKDPQNRAMTTTANMIWCDWEDQQPSDEEPKEDKRKGKAHAVTGEAIG